MATQEAADEQPAPARVARETRRFARWLAAAVGAVLLGIFVPKFFDGPAYVITLEENTDELATAQGHVGDSSYYVVFDRTIGDIPPPPVRDADTCRGRYDWATKGLKGFQANSSTFRFVVESRSDSEVRIEDLKVTRTSSSPPPVDGAGVELACGGQGARADIRSVKVDLSEPEPTAKVTDPNSVPIEPVFTLTKGQSETFEVTGLALECDCSWQLIVSVRHEGELRDEVVGSFRTVSAINLPTYHWIDGDWVNIDEDPGGSSMSATERTDACALLDDDVAASVLGAPVTPPSGGVTSPTRGASGAPMAVSVCSLASEQPAKGGDHHSFAVIFQTASSPQNAIAEYDALVQKFSRQLRSQGNIAGLGEAATLLEGVVVARRGNEVVVVQVTSPDAAVSARVEAFARDVIGRAWPDGSSP